MPPHTSSRRPVHTPIGSTRPSTGAGGRSSQRSAAGSQAGQYTIPGHGLAYDPAGNRWDDLPPAPVLGRVDPIAGWTGRRLLVWGGTDPYHPYADGAECLPVRLDQPSSRS